MVFIFCSNSIKRFLRFVRIVCDLRKRFRFHCRCLRRTDVCYSSRLARPRQANQRVRLAAALPRLRVTPRTTDRRLVRRIVHDKIILLTPNHIFVTVIFQNLSTRLSYLYCIVTYFTFCRMVVRRAPLLRSRLLRRRWNDCCQRCNVIFNTANTEARAEKSRPGGQIKGDRCNVLARDKYTCFIKKTKNKMTIRSYLHNCCFTNKIVSRLIDLKEPAWDTPISWLTRSRSNGSESVAALGIAARELRKQHIDCCASFE